MKFIFWIADFKKAPSGILVVNDNVWCKREEWNNVIKWLNNYNVPYETNTSAVKEITIDDPNDIYLALFVLDKESKAKET